jgi:hypothetical protein
VKLTGDGGLLPPKPVELGEDKILSPMGGRCWSAARAS